MVAIAPGSESWAVCDGFVRNGIRVTFCDRMGGDLSATAILSMPGHDCPRPRHDCPPVDAWPRLPSIVPCPVAQASMPVQDRPPRDCPRHRCPSTITHDHLIVQPGRLTFEATISRNGTLARPKAESTRRFDLARPLLRGVSVSRMPPVSCRVPRVPCVAPSEPRRPTRPQSSGFGGCSEPSLAHSRAITFHAHRRPT